VSRAEMRPIRATIGLDEARGLIDGAIVPVARTERVAVDEANHRVIAQPVIAPGDVPPFARAAMDGYAVRAADTVGASTHSPRVLTWLETVFTA
jgi:molybdopterin molybdotransferase